LAKNAS